MGTYKSRREFCLPKFLSIAHFYDKLLWFHLYCSLVLTVFYKNHSLRVMSTTVLIPFFSAPKRHVPLSYNSALITYIVPSSICNFFTFLLGNYISFNNVIFCKIVSMKYSHGDKAQFQLKRLVLYSFLIINFFVLAHTAQKEPKKFSCYIFVLSIILNFAVEFCISSL